LSWLSEEDYIHSQKASEATVDARGGTALCREPAAHSSFLPGSYFSSLVGVPQGLSVLLHIHIKTSRKDPSRKNY
jgi:hypothetical protein